jgi:hypothetical protein
MNSLLSRGSFDIVARSVENKCGLNTDENFSDFSSVFLEVLFDCLRTLTFYFVPMNFFSAGVSSNSGRSLAVSWADFSVTNFSKSSMVLPY